MRERATPRIEPMRAEDVEAVFRIAQASFPAPWSREMIAEDLERPFAYVRVLRPAPGQPIAAFIGCWLVRDEVHVLNVATDAGARRRGYARMLMEDVFRFARQHLASIITLEVRRSNAAAQRLYRTMGFERAGVRRGYYTDDGEDAIVMICRL